LLVAHELIYDFKCNLLLTNRLWLHFPVKEKQHKNKDRAYTDTPVLKELIGDNT